MTNPTQNPPIVCEVFCTSGDPVAGAQPHKVLAPSGHARFRVQILTFADHGAMLEWVAAQAHPVLIHAEPYGPTGPAWCLEICDERG